MYFYFTSPFFWPVYKRQQAVSGRKLLYAYKTQYTHTHPNTNLAVLGCVEDVNSAGFDTVGLGPSVQSKAALSAPTVSAWKRAIVPAEKQTKITTYEKKKRTWNWHHVQLMRLEFLSETRVNDFTHVRSSSSYFNEKA